ncbi:MAG: ATP-dependent Clp protease ATP-binding subunit ClpA, partial [Acetatifactor sp.]|nr:ATP-dependent Clp protease ATP-binding subunit ClpA [Acetatifactor sp.]
MRVSEEVEKIVDMTVGLAKNASFEIVVPELMLYAICQNEIFAQAFENCGGSVRELDYHLRTYLENYMEYKSEADESDPQVAAVARIRLDLQLRSGIR